MLFLVYALTACLQLLRLSAKHKGRAVLSPDFRAVIRETPSWNKFISPKFKVSIHGCWGKNSTWFFGKQISPQPKIGV